MAIRHKFSARSLAILEELHPKLRDVIRLSLPKTRYDFGLVCGLRTIEQQEEMVKSGKSMTMNSKHLPDENGKSRAVDLIVYNLNGQISWHEKEWFNVAQTIFHTSAELSTPITWGGLWVLPHDKPHFELA